MSLHSTFTVPRKLGLEWFIHHSKNSRILWRLYNTPSLSTRIDHNPIKSTPPSAAAPRPDKAGGLSLSSPGLCHGVAVVQKVLSRSRAGRGGGEAPPVVLSTQALLTLIPVTRDKERRYTRQQIATQKWQQI